MDKQLACATFATLIPVLSIAGWLSNEWLTLADLDKLIRRSVGLFIVIAYTGELIVISGVADPTMAAVRFGEIGTYAALVGVAIPVTVRLGGFVWTPGMTKHHKHRDDDADDAENGQAPDPPDGT